MIIHRITALLAVTALMTITGCKNNPVSSADEYQGPGGSASIRLVAATGSTFSVLAKRADAKITAPGMDSIRQNLIMSGNGITGTINNIPAGYNRKFEVFAYDSLGKICYYGTSNADVANGINVHVPMTIYRSSGAGTGSATIDGAIYDSLPSVPNMTPTVYITAPAYNATFKVGDSIQITAAAIDSDGTIMMVTFYKDSMPIGVDSSAPYKYTLRNVQAGTFNIRAYAQDNRGAIGWSGDNPVIVATSVNKIPTVSMTSPAFNATYKPGDSIQLAAAAIDSDGTIKSVTFYRDSTLITIDSAVPYAYTLTNVTAGSYTFKAVATDNKGAKGQSGNYPVTVTASSSKPVITYEPTSRTVILGQNTVFTVVASGNPAPTYQWFKNGTPLAGRTSSSFTLTSVAFPDSGLYSVIVNNSAGTDTSIAANLSVVASTSSDITNLSGNIFSARGENGTNEGFAKAFDNNASTKWLDFSPDSLRGSWLKIQFASGASKRVTSYKMTSANDAQERDPNSWSLQGSVNGTTWVNVDSRSAITFASRAQTQTFTVATPGTYQYYRLNITRVYTPSAANSVQLAELRIIGY